MNTQTVTVPVDGTVLVITKTERAALEAMLGQLDLMKGVALDGTNWQAIYQLARELQS